MNAVSPLMTAGSAVASAFRLEERVQALVEPLLAARNFVAGLQHDADREAADLLRLIDKRLGAETIPYRGWVITFSPPPIPTRTCDWQYVHSDYDGPEDNRAGHAATLGAALDEIDAREAG